MNFTEDNLEISQDKSECLLQYPNQSAWPGWLAGTLRPDQSVFEQVSACGWSVRAGMQGSEDINQCYKNMCVIVVVYGVDIFRT